MKRIVVGITLVVSLLILGGTPPSFSQAPATPSVIQIDLGGAAHALPHFWERMFGSERAIVTLRESWRNDLRSVKRITGFEYVRFHAIFHDEMGVYTEDETGKPVFNFSYVDQVYDGLLENGVKPYVELSFMPRALSSQPTTSHAFFYKQNVAPPKDYGKWDAMMAAFVGHLVERYGIEEVSTVVFRGLERTEHRFLDRRAEAGDLFRALRSYGADDQESEFTFAGRRAFYGAGGLGGQIYRALRGGKCAGGFCFDARLRK